MSSTELTVTVRGQVTLRREVLKHLRLRPGDRLEIDLLPNGEGVLRAARPRATAGGFIGLLAGRTEKVATLDEINRAIVDGWAGTDAAGG